MTQEVSEIAKQLVSEFGSKELPKGRPHELEIEIKRSLTAIAGRIDDGYNISVRTGELPSTPEDEEVSEESAQLARYASDVQERSQALTFMNLTGSPILGLSRSVEEPEPEAQADTDQSVQPD